MSARSTAGAAPRAAARAHTLRVSALARPVKKGSGGAAGRAPARTSFAVSAGAAPAKTAAPSATVAVTPEVAKDLYRDMVLGREFEVREGEMERGGRDCEARGPGGRRVRPRSALGVWEGVRACRGPHSPVPCHHG